MCGLAGIASTSEPASADLIKRMCDAIAHRGPDSEGMWFSPERHVGLGHRRLAIVDLAENANQPMTDEQSGTTIVFNGEIYNHLELRCALERQGRPFKTDHSDTETLLQGYIAWGLERLLQSLNGMFAFAIYDRPQDRLFLVRDRMGIKPLYYAYVNQSLVFASEIKALLLHPALEPQLHKGNFAHYLSFRAVPAPGTLFKDIEKLGAGCLLEMDLKAGAIYKRGYWDPLHQAATPPRTRAQAEERLGELLDSAVSYRLMADVPVGVFLSGGLDSGYLLALAAERKSDISTFTVNYPGYEQYNEDQSAARLAAQAKAEHHEVPIVKDQYFQSMLAVSYFQDEPIAAPVCASVYFLAQAAHKAGVPVVLSGEGSDEVFIGYRQWLIARDGQRLVDWFPPFVSRLASAALLPFLQGLSGFSKYPEFVRRASQGQPLFWGGAIDFSEYSKRRLIGPALREIDLNETYCTVIQPLRDQFLALRKADDITGWMSYVDLKFRLPELMLMRGDKMGMAFSIEGRVPYLDHRIVEFFMGLPPEWRSATGRQNKDLLKSVAAPKLGRDFVYQKKRGFAAPMQEWKIGGKEDWYYPKIIAFARRTGLFELGPLRQLLARREDRLNFNIINFMLWYLIFIENVLPEYFPDIRCRSWVRK